MKYIFYLFQVLLVFISLSCKDEGTGTTFGNENVQTKQAVLLWTGAYEVDGCGFFVLIEDKRYKPENENEINNEFKKNDSTNVRIKYELLNREIPYNCGVVPTLKVEGIKVISIDKI